MDGVFLLLISVVSKIYKYLYSFVTKKKSVKPMFISFCSLNNLIIEVCCVGQRMSHSPKMLKMAQKMLNNVKKFQKF